MIETERLVLRLFQTEDEDDFIRLFTDQTVMKFVDTGVYSTEKAENLWRKLIDEFYPNGINTIYGVFAKDDGRHLGTASIRPRPEKNNEWEITYILKPDEWGQGYATEIARKLIEFGFNELNLEAVLATVDTDHLASIHVLEKAGMKHFRDEYDEQGKFYVYRRSRH